MRVLFFLYISLYSISSLVLAQEPNTQNIRGQIVDKASKFPIIGASVIVIGTDPLVGSATNLDGYFELKGVSIGRVILQISAIGYETITPSNLLVVAGKELQADFSLEENFPTLQEVVVTAGDNKEDLNNEWATVSARTFNTEETARYSGSRNDPARMAANFAGVSGANDSRNDIIIRGNSPTGLLWRLEDIDIPSPNHFASFGSTGGPVSMLNNNLLAKSDFITAAFPANYGNALAGVFDLKLRSGNNKKSEFLGQIGFNGFELGAEGPFSRKANASYLVNYRYSTLGVFQTFGIEFGTGAAVPNFQDLSFKVDIPTKKAGRFTVFGIGGMSDISFLGSETDFSELNVNLFTNETEDLRNETATGIIGLSHTLFLGKKTYYKMVLSASHQRSEVAIDSLTWDSNDPDNITLLAITPYVSINLRQNKYVGHWLLNHKLNAKNNFIFGVISTIYDVSFADSTYRSSGNSLSWRTVKEGKGTSTQLQGYTNWQRRFTKNLTMNAGVHLLYFGLPSKLALSPRIGFRWATSPASSINIAYGMHHQLQPLPVYYTKRSNGTVSNNIKLNFTRSQHLALGYDQSLGKNFRLKMETYYQSLSNVPVEPNPSSFSMLNAGAAFNTPNEYDLVNEGIGCNYGVELTLEKFYSQQYYLLLTTSVFKSEYRGSDKVWRSTAFNGGYVVNFLGGKEWNLSSQNHTLAFDMKMTFAGGRKYTPIDLATSRINMRETLFEDRAFSQQYDNYFRLDMKISYRMNRPKATHEFSIDVQNVTNRDNIFSQAYNRRTGEVARVNQLGLFPVPQYRILF